MSQAKTGQFLPEETDVKFSCVQEPFTIYRTEDGATIRVKLVLMKATKTGKVLPNGKPEINLSWQQVMDVEWPTG